MVNKLTQQIIDALGRAAAESAGLPLFASKAEPGLFPSVASAKPAAQKCLADGLIRVTHTESRGKTTRELYILTEPGWEFLLAQVNPKQVLEDFVRVLEARQGEVGELLTIARRMAVSLQGLKDAVGRVLPQVMVSRIAASSETFPASPYTREPVNQPTASHIANRLEAGGPMMNGTAVLDAPPSRVEKGRVESGRQECLPHALVAHLADWAASAGVGEDCPLPELFRSLTMHLTEPTIGEFHDCLRKLHEAGTIYLHPWTGPLYALPEPAYALLIGHGIAYYASIR